ncbi:biotin/lipoyl-binding protein, partial [Candidatus Poribacteria bacterium]|nr:biotin/lipoyl-binding protein [Candidatus Poribacteria bacterium]
MIVSCGGSPEVKTVTPATKPIEQSFTEPARTRLSALYPITMPVSGRVGRIVLEPGDPVTKGQTLAELDIEPLRRDAEA